MSDEIRVNRPQARPDQPMQSQPMHHETRGSSKLPWVILGIVVVLLVVVSVLFRDKLFSTKQANTAKTANMSGSYQAVFLTNGQVYFGKVTNMSESYVTLTDIYYLQVIQKEPLQGTPQTTAQPQQEISLVKLGNELHGPVDEMHINQQQILFYEDLKAEGAVVKAITDDKAKQAAPAK